MNAQPSETAKSRNVTHGNPRLRLLARPRKEALQKPRALRLRFIDGWIHCAIEVGASSIEAFANDGEAVVTGLIFPSSGDRRLELFSSSAALKMKAFDVWELKTNWR